MNFRQFIENINNLQNEIKNLYPDVKIWVYESPNHITLDEIKVPKEMRGQGIGTKIIKLIQNYAKIVNKPIVLTPFPERGYKQKLLNFYKNLGFVTNTGRNIDFTLSSPIRTTMYWKP